MSAGCSITWRSTAAPNARRATPTPRWQPEPWLDFSSGYVQRAVGRFPKQGSRAPWRVYQNYARDLVSLRFGAVDDGVMEFSNPRRA